MDEYSQKDSEKTTENVAVAGERLVYVVSPDAAGMPSDNQITLIDLCRIVWSGKWLISGTTAVCIALGVAYAFTATEWYRAEVLVTPAEERSTPGLARQLGGLASLASFAGVSVGGGGSTEPIAVLRSRDFTRSFIEDRDLLPVFFAESWNAEEKKWIHDGLEESPDIRDGVEYFSTAVREVSEDLETGLVTLAVHWTDPVVAAEWANDLISRVNDHMRQRALAEAEANVAYLREELDSTNVATLRQSIGNLLETELQKLMLAKGNEEFAFRVIDRAQVPKWPHRPRRALIVVLAAFLGGTGSLLFVFVRHAIHRYSTG